MVGVLRFLHGKTNQIVTGKIDVRGRGRVQFPGQAARKDRPVDRLVTQLDANFGAVAIDEFCGLLPANQGHVVTRHQQLCRQQGAIRGPKDQNVARHTLSSTDDAGISKMPRPGQAENFRQASAGAEQRSSQALHRTGTARSGKARRVYRRLIGITIS